MRQVRRARSPLLRYGMSQVCLDVQFWFPVWFIFLIDRGFTFGQAALADSLFRIGVVVLEVPMGYVADRIGRVRAYRMLCLLTALTYVAISVVSTVGLLLSVWLLWSLQWALGSGLGAAIGYDYAVQIPVLEERRRIFARLRAASATGALVSLATAGLLYQIDPAAPFLATAGLALVAALIAGTLPDVYAARRQRRAGNPRSWMRSAWNDRPQRILLAAASVFLLLIWSVQILFQPLALYLNLSPSSTSLMFTACAASGMLGTLSAARWRRRSAWSPQLMCGGLVSVLCLVTAIWPWAAPWAFLPALSLAAAFGWTVTEFSVSEAVDGPFLTTALSLVSAAAGVGIAVARPALLLGAEQFGAPAAVAGWGVVALALSMLIAYFRSRPGVRL